MINSAYRYTLCQFKFLLSKRIVNFPHKTKSLCVYPIQNHSNYGRWKYRQKLFSFVSNTFFFGCVLISENRNHLSPWNVIYEWKDALGKCPFSLFYFLFYLPLIYDRMYKYQKFHANWNKLNKSTNFYLCLELCC